MTDTPYTGKLICPWCGDRTMQKAKHLLDEYEVKSCREHIEMALNTDLSDGERVWAARKVIEFGFNLENALGPDIELTYRNIFRIQKLRELPKDPPVPLIIHKSRHYHRRRRHIRQSAGNTNIRIFSIQCNNCRRE